MHRRPQASVAQTHDRGFGDHSKPRDRYGKAGAFRMMPRRFMLAAALVLAFCSGLSLAGAAQAAEQEEIMLWPATAPGRGGVTGPERIVANGPAKGALSNVKVPRMRVYRPAAPNGAAVLVAGGGGYFRIQLIKESTPVALWLQAQGFTVFELIYRLPGDGWEAAVPFMDAQRAMKIIRFRAAEFKVNPARIGFMGFSAGGHLAGLTAYQPDRKLYAGSDRYEAVSARPDFAVLLFPVVTLRKPFNTRTRREIIGNKPSAEAEASWSLDSHVSASSPPTIIFAAADDPITPPAHGILLFETLQQAKAPVELHLFRSGGHGWGLGNPGEPVSQWPALFVNWFNSLNQK